MCPPPGPPECGRAPECGALGWGTLQWVYEHKDLQDMGEPLGGGSFGTVCRAVLNGRPVAVKTLIPISKAKARSTATLPPASPPPRSTPSGCVGRRG